MDEGTGLLFKPENAGELSARIVELAENPALRKHMGERGRKKMESEFNVHSTHEKMKKEFIGALASQD